MVTALCNVYINSEGKFALFKDNFSKVYPISDNWLVYIRGKYRKQVVVYIKKEFKDYKNNVIFFNNLFDGNWAKSTSEMIKKSRYDYIYVFLEDHFLQTPLKHFKDVLNNMKENHIDYFQYSFFNIGLPTYSIEHLYPDSVDHFYTFNLNSDQLPGLRKTNKSFYPYSLTSVSSKKFFNKLLKIEKKHLVRVPILVQALMENMMFFYPRDRAIWFKINQLTKFIGLRFVIYPPASPFNLEKSLFDCDKEILPFKVGTLKEELFANWDDDNKLSNSSLIKRGLYPNYFRISKRDKPERLNYQEYFLLKGQSSNHQYCPDIPRTTKIPQKYIYIKKGEMKISSELESFVLKSGQSVWVVSNIPHKYLAVSDCTYSYYICDS